MRYSSLGSIVVLLAQTTGLVLPPRSQPTSNSIARRQNETDGDCKNTADSRNCWSSGFDIDSNYYEVVPDTGVTREYWLDVVNTTMAPDGVTRTVLSFNGSVPGPTIFAEWGDNLVIHVRNSLQDNGTSIHWHGMQQRGTNEADGVPGVTECPIVPGHTRTYRFRATQYGTSWAVMLFRAIGNGVISYHLSSPLKHNANSHVDSHFTLQYGDGLLGPIVIRGPTTANYDEDLGALILNDWSHQTAFELWANHVRYGGAPPVLENGLINGTNVWDCSGTQNPNCSSSGRRFEITIKKGQRYLIRLVNSAIDGAMKFSIDNHQFKVVANDFVPVIPYQTNNILLSVGQRYDIIVEATQEVYNYWLRAVWMTQCSGNLAGSNNNIRGIVRYEGADTNADPVTSQSSGITQQCGDENPANLVPHLALNVGGSSSTKTLNLDSLTDDRNWFFWRINNSSLWLEWENPTTLQILNGEQIFPTDYNVYPVTPVNEWVYFIIQSDTNAPFGVNHPIHLHGHDFWVIGQGQGLFDPANPNFNLENPMRRDVATLPAKGYLAMAFYTDNPGSWLIHCHIAWHASQGLSLQFVEREGEIAGNIPNQQEFRDQCSAWKAFETIMPDEQEDSGI